METMTKIKLKDVSGLIISLITVLILSGCQKVVNVDLNEAEPHIVIEGLIEDLRGPFSVAISKSGSYFDQPVLETVSGAQVVITDSKGTIDTLNETTPGLYITSKTRGIPGRTYTLKVVAENLEYIGTTTMFSHVNIDSLTLEKSLFQHIDFGGGDPNETHYDIHCFFKDPEEKNFYRVKVFKNDSINTQNYRLYDDQYTNGEETELRIGNATSGDTYRIELMSLDQSTYNYYRTLSDLLYSNPIFGSTPANPNSNLSNGALGYFGACAVSSKTIVISDSLIKTLK